MSNTSGSPSDEPTGEHAALHPEVLPPGFDPRSDRHQHGHDSVYRGSDYPRAVGTDSAAITAFVLAILSFVICPLLPAIGAVAIAPGAKRRIRQSNGEVQGMAFARAGQWIGWANIILVVTLGWLLIRLIGWVFNQF